VVRVEATALNGPVHRGPQGLAAAVVVAWAGHRQRVAMAHLLALLAALVSLAVDAGGPLRPAQLFTGIVIFVGFAVLRVASVDRRLAISTLALDAVGTATVLAGTGAPGSAYYFLALAGAWWAAHVPRRGSGLLWALAFVAAYGALVAPDALRDRLLAQALEDGSVVIIVALLSNWLIRVDRRTIQLSDMLARVPAGAEKLAIREGLTRALGPMEISIDLLLAAANAGLTVIQAELLAYLQMGLTNQEIADATRVGEATVRYRLTRLYRALGVRGRKAAVERAMALAYVSSAAGSRTGTNLT
jgi:DNA-binding CsgD family transcriptional regulator